MSHPPECWPALQKAWTRLYVIIYVTFLAALHGHSHGNKAGPALGRGFCARRVYIVAGVKH